MEQDYLYFSQEFHRIFIESHKFNIAEVFYL
jgi:hypothetical protein